MKTKNLLLFAFVVCISASLYAQAGQEKPYYRSSITMWYNILLDSPERNPKYFEAHWIKESRVRSAKFGYYAADDEAKLDYDLRMFKRWGIDCLLLDDTNHHWNDEGNLDEHIRAVYKKAAELGELAPKINIAGGRPLIEGDIAGMQAELDLFAKFAEQYPNQTFIWKGKPLFVNFNIEQNLSYQDQKGRFTMRPATGMASDVWDVRHKHNLMQIGLWGWPFDIQYEGSEVYGVMPGWSRTHNGMYDYGYKPISRENGKRYQEAWLAAIKANPEMIVIVSWNDHNEENGIEAVEILSPIPGRETDNENPYYYEQITEGYLGLKTGYIENFYYRSEDNTQVYQFKNGKLKKITVSGRTAVIVVPADYFEWAGVERE